MPIPIPELLYLPEAAAYVATRCAVPQNEAEVALERKIRDCDRLYLINNEGKALNLPNEYEGMTFDWRTGLVETRWGPQGRLRIPRRLLDEWIGPAVAKAAPREIEQDAQAPSSADTGDVAPSHNGAPAPDRRRGPQPGSVNRYGEADRALFPEITRIMQEARVTAHAAALKLAEGGTEGKRVEGSGTSESRAKRLATAYLASCRKSKTR